MLVINAQKQIRIARQALVASREQILNLQVEIDDLVEQLINQRDVNALTKKRQRRQNLLSLSAFVLKESFASSDINATLSFKRSIKHLDLDKFTDDANSSDQIELAFDN